MEGRCTLGFLIGLSAPAVCGPRQLLQRPSKFPRKLIKGSLSGEVYAFSGTMGHMARLGEFYVSFADASPAMVGMEVCESLLARPDVARTGLEKFFALRFSRIQQALEQGDSDNAFRPTGPGSPADGLAEVKGNPAPLLGPSSGILFPGASRVIGGHGLLWEFWRLGAAFFLVAFVALAVSLLLIMYICAFALFLFRSAGRQSGFKICFQSGIQ